MWPFKKNVKRDFYKVEYVHGASIDGDIVAFDLKYFSEIYVEATDLMDAQKEFAKCVMLTPHVYVHKISKIAISPVNKVQNF